MTDRDGRIAAARAVRLEDELARRGIWLRRCGAELVGPCPACGGVDRFSVHRAKQVWHCRVAGRGGDVIDLVEYLDGCGFVEAVAALAGPGPSPGSTTAPTPAPPPEGEGCHSPLATRQENEYRAREIARAREIWQAAGPLPGSPAEAYLAFRGVTAPAGAKLRCHGRCRRWEKLGHGWRVIHEGPALVAAIAGNDDGTGGRFQGVQVTWVEPALLTPDTRHLIPAKGRATIVHPETGEVLAAKIVRGSSRGGHIHLGGGGPPPAPPPPGEGCHSPLATRHSPATRLVIGEGTETVLAVANAEAALDPALFRQTAYWCSVGLQNLGGKAAGSVRHPSLKRTDRLGRERALTVPGPVPLISEAHPAIMPPAGVVEVVTLADGDSDRFTVEQVHARAATRWRSEGRTVVTAWPDEGTDFNAMLRGCAA
jgi:hypothetical protein